MGTPGVVRVVFTGVHGSEDYIRLAGYLQGLAVVRGITPVKATPDGLVADLDLVSGLEGFRRMLDQDVLEPTDAVQPPTFVLH